MNEARRYIIGENMYYVTVCKVHSKRWREPFRGEPAASADDESSPPILPPRSFLFGCTNTHARSAHEYIYPSIYLSIHPSDPLGLVGQAKSLPRQRPYSGSPPLSVSSPKICTPVSTGSGSKDASLLRHANRLQTHLFFLLSLRSWLASFHPFRTE